jgi:hypothetical protein
VIRVGDVLKSVKWPRGDQAQRPKEDDMPLVIGQGGEQKFEPAPPGLHQAVCVDVVDLGLVDGKFGPKSKVKLIWQIEMKNKEGERFQARATYTQSLFDGSNLRRDLEAWRGRTFTQEELNGFDVEKLIGVNCQLSLKHNVSKSTGRTYAQVTVVLPPVKGANLKPENYTREPWPGSKPAVVAGNPGPQTVPDDGNESIPF